MKRLALLVPWATLLFAAVSVPSIAAQKFVYPESISPTFEGTDEKSAKQGYKKCEISVTLVKEVAQGVEFRVKLITDGKVVVSTLTVDVVEFTVSNGVPYDPRRRPISTARVVSNVFETTTMPQVDMGDGGLGIALDPPNFGKALALVARGDYLIGFVPKGTDDETVYAVRQGVDAKVLGQFGECMNRM